MEIILGAAFFLILVLSILFNALFLTVFCLRRRLKCTGHYTLFVAMAFVDLLAAGVWTGISAAAATLDWQPEGELCHLQSYFFTFTQIMTAFSLATVALERLLRMVKPSHHKMVFVPKVTAFLIFSLVVFCGVVSSIHLYGSLDTTWHSTERQCRADFTESVKMLRMSFSFDYAIPYWVIALPAFIGAYIKVVLARKNPSPYGEIVLEKNSYAPGDSYSSRLSKIQSKFGESKDKTRGKRKPNSKKPSLGKKMYSNQGFTEMEHWDSDIDDGDTHSASGDAKLRSHALPRPEFKMLITSAVIAMVTALLWFPWIVVRFILSYTPRDPVPDEWILVAVICTHLSAFIKPILFFLFNPFFRSAFRKTFSCCRKKKGQLLNQQQETPIEGKENMAFRE